MRSKMRKSHAFGTKSMPLKKLPKNMKKSRKLSAVNTRMLTATAINKSSLLPSSTKSCQHISDRNDLQALQPEVAPVSHITLPAEGSKSQATQNAVLPDHTDYVEHIYAQSPKHTSTAIPHLAPSDPSPELSSTEQTPIAPVTSPTGSKQSVPHHRPSAARSQSTSPASACCHQHDSTAMTKSHLAAMHRLQKTSACRRLMRAATFCIEVLAMGRGCLFKAVRRL
ncbi:uncharacterized protein M421DRAFT_328792 [Didymella exigua CBS 183.55]|uniref:Uncharacterized protein n=1 Tax=Didymella exigua CBS 183.55 TaxID=1150837 RepID=A0A6A5R7K8_9PLEO|nr:uncharacterized protein M421DRAFT_328792 [Didymella exigua CBS 183.55]KAF1923190.1 hypothetical protein M421DRAFT_328792 [Didymella exigua CBS 183.55]